jgi:Holliday junction resolvasome RuvABC endonuclease subunit
VILGIDAAKNRTGWALLTDDERLIETGVIVIDHSDEDRRRAFQMVRDELVSIGRMADARDVDVVGVFVESAFLGPSAKVAIEHARWIGSVEAIAWRVFGYALIEMVSPREWRQILGITGKGKEPVRAWGEGQWPELATRSQDEIDAAAIACAALRKVEVVA